MNIFSRLLLAFSCLALPAFPVGAEPYSYPGGNETGLLIQDTIPGLQLKVLSYNIHHCNPPGAGDRIDAGAIASVIRQAAPDLVALQEVDVHTSRSGSSLHQAAELARLTGMHYYFAKAIDYEGGEYGVAVLSRFPIVDSATVSLPVKKTLGGETRTVAAATLRLPGGREMIFASTHLDHKFPENSLMQAKRLVRFLKKKRLPVVLAGDFNAEPGSATIEYTDRFFTRTCGSDCAGTIPVDDPAKAIDFIMYRPQDDFAVQSHTVLRDEKASDHLPVAADIILLSR